MSIATVHFYAQNVGAGDQEQVSETPAGPLAATVSPGSPGTFSAGVQPSSQAELSAKYTTLSDFNPASLTTWSVGQWVDVGADGHYYWNGSAWASRAVGTVPASAVNASWTTTGRPPYTKAELDAKPGGAAWTTAGHYTAIGGTAVGTANPSSRYYWNGTSWVQGAVPA